MTRRSSTLSRPRVWIALAGALIATPLIAAGVALPSWAYSTPDAQQPQLPPRTGTYTLPGSTKQFTQAQVDNLKAPPDWFPEAHPAAPPAVVAGKEDFQARACAGCHLMSGIGHPESSSLAGLPVAYMQRQMAELRSGARGNNFTPGATDRNDLILAMAAIARAWSEAETDSALRYFSALKPASWVKVVEATTVPKSYVARSFARYPLPGGGTEPLGQRIVELPVDAEAMRLRDPRSGTIAYVPTGSIARGRVLAATCSACHGAALKGEGDAPPIAGRSPLYTARQLLLFKSGARNGSMAPIMQASVQDMSERDIIDVAAYAGSLRP